MFILPFVCTRSPPSPSSSPLTILRILTLGGKDLWQEDDMLRLAEDILEPNGLPLLRHHSHKGIHFCQLDPTQLDLSEYYDWEEVDPTATPPVFCWRTFYWMGDTLPPPSTAYLGPFPCELLLRECATQSTS